MQPDLLREEVAAVFGEIVAAKRLVRSGRSVELDGLDTRVGALCEAVVALSAEDGRALLPLLGDLRASLDELAEALTAASPGDNGPAAP